MSEKQKYFIGGSPNVYIDGFSNVSTSTSYPTTTLAHLGQLKVKIKNSTGGFDTGYIPVFEPATS